MRAPFVVLLLAAVFTSASLHAMFSLQIGIRYEPDEQYEDLVPNPTLDSALTDPVIDDTTVKWDFQNDPTVYGWRGRLQVAATGNYDLSTQPNLDVTALSRVRLAVQCYPESHPEALNSVKVMGTLHSFAYNRTLNVFEMEVSPAQLTPTASLLNGGLMLDIIFSYLGNSPLHPGGQIDYSDTVLVSNVVYDDLGPLQHSSSWDLWGNGFSVNGIQDETEAEFHIISQVPAFQAQIGGLDANLAEAYVDGYQTPAYNGFSLQLGYQDEFQLNAEDGDPTNDEVARMTFSHGLKYSERDMQIGVFNNPWWGCEKVDMDDAWKQSDWFGWVWEEDENGEGWFYHLYHTWQFLPAGQTYDNMNIYDQELGWLFTTDELYPDLYSETEGWLWYQPETSNPRWFWKYASQEWVRFPPAP